MQILLYIHLPGQFATVTHLKKKNKNFNKDMKAENIYITHQFVVCLMLNKSQCTRNTEQVLKHF